MTKRLIRGKMVIDGTGNHPIEQGAVLIDGQTIKAVGKRTDIETEPDTEEIDFSECVLIPGLIDCHNHLSLDTRLDNYLLRMNDTIPELTLRAVANLLVDLDSGVTTSRCCGDKGYLDIACKQAIEAGYLKGPRLLVAGKGIRASHGHGFVGYPFDGLEPVRGAVRENLRHGVDLIKLYITGTIKASGHIPAYLSKSEISLAIQESKRLQVKTATHCIGGIGVDWALELGIDSIEHGYFLTEEQIDRMAQSDSWLVITPSPFFEENRIRTLPSHLRDGFLRQRDEVAERITAAIKGGVKYAVGTDGMHGGLAKELEWLTEFGASAQDALKAATVNGASVCGLASHIGTLESGKYADIVAVDGDPLKDIRSLRRVRGVIYRGRIRRIN
ncbi:MAG: amidohydrolase family protein [Deltaproteobacteria bacterium]|nr:amidohydrolase family protein [Deltaproteobacteria bacterium]MBW2150966.1 amidohydrolase family protein [Deltaproteobacteria bacterium]